MSHHPYIYASTLCSEWRDRFERAWPMRKRISARQACEAIYCSDLDNEDKREGIDYILRRYYKVRWDRISIQCDALLGQTTLYRFKKALSCIINKRPL